MAIVLVPKDSLPVSRIWRGNVYVPDDEGTEELPQDLLDALGQPKQVDPLKAEPKQKAKKQ